MNMLILSTVLLLVVSPGLGAEELKAAPGYTIPWFTVDAGGGVSSLATFRLVGAAGQPDAGFSIDGATTVTSGFWSVGSGNPVFADGFESGSSGAWSLHVP
jgi:hypothetical protein